MNSLFFKSVFRGGENFQQRHQKGQSGFTLVELMVTLGIGGVLMAGLFTFINYTFKSQKSLALVQVRDQLLETVRRTAGDSEALRNSADLSLPMTASRNQNFARCINPSGSDTCTSASPQPFLLLSKLAPTGGTAVPVAGTVAEPVRYTRDGGRCAFGTSDANSPATVKKCPFEAIVFFQASCNGCKNPEAVSISYVIRPAAGTDIATGNAPVAAVGSADQSYLNLAGSVGVAHATMNPTVVSLRDVRTLTNGQCPVGAVKLGVHGTGDPKEGYAICECNRPYVATGTNAVTGQPVCTLPANQNTCPPDHVPGGVDSNGNRVCKSLSSAGCFEIWGAVGQCSGFGPCMSGGVNRCRVVGMPWRCYTPCWTTCDKWGCWMTCGAPVCAWNLRCCGLN